MVGNTGIEQGTTKTWIDQAKVDYRDALFANQAINPRYNKIWENPADIPDALLPSKLVMLAHSQGNS